MTMTPRLRNRDKSTGLMQKMTNASSKAPTNNIVEAGDEQKEHNMPLISNTPTTYASSVPACGTAVGLNRKGSIKNRHHYHSNSLTYFRVFWLTIMLWCGFAKVADGLPLLTSSENNMFLIHSLNYKADDNEDCGQGLLCAEMENVPEQLPYEDLEIKEDDIVDNANAQDSDSASSFSQTDDTELKTFNGPRTKKGLSYLSKYFSTGVLNDVTMNGNSDVSAEGLSHYTNQFFGVGNRSGGRSTTSVNSNEQRFPSPIRSKLSFYPPVVSSYSSLMTPWSRNVAGRPTTSMRLRWGK